MAYSFFIPALDCICLVLDLEMDVTEDCLGTILHLNGDLLWARPLFYVVTGASPLKSKQLLQVSIFSSENKYKSISLQPVYSKPAPWAEG